MTGAFTAAAARVPTAVRRNVRREGMACLSVVTGEFRSVPSKVETGAERVNEQHGIFRAEPQNQTGRFLTITIVFFLILPGRRGHDAGGNRKDRDGSKESEEFSCG
jgi:hypothetical protein